MVPPAAERETRLSRRPQGADDESDESVRGPLRGRAGRTLHGGEAKVRELSGRHVVANESAGHTLFDELVEKHCQVIVRTPRVLALVQESSQVGPMVRIASVCVGGENSFKLRSCDTCGLVDLQTAWRYGAGSTASSSRRRRLAAHARAVLARALATPVGEYVRIVAPPRRAARAPIARSVCTRNGPRASSDLFTAAESVAQVGVPTTGSTASTSNYYSMSFMRRLHPLTARVPRWCAFGVLVALAVLSVSAPRVADAQSSDEKKRELEQQIGEASLQELEAIQILQALGDERAAIDARVAALDQQIAAAQARLSGQEQEAARLAVDYERVRMRLQAAEAKLDDAQEALDDAAAQMYRSARNGSQYETALASPPADLVQSDAYLDTVSNQRRRIVDRVELLRDEIEARRRAVEADKQQAEDARAAAQTERDTIASLRAQIEPVRAQAAASQAAEEQALASIQARKAEFEGELAALQAASARVTALLAGGSRGSASVPCEARPVAGAIRSGYGQRVHPIYGTARMHNGVDMAAGMGQPIRACRAGIVIQAGPNGGYGNTIVIDHGGGMATLYAHQSSLAVGAGALVGAGEIIGYVGSTGASTGPHLHFEVRLNGSPVDPAPYL